MTEVLSSTALPLFPARIELLLPSEDSIRSIEERASRVARAALDMHAVIVMETELRANLGEKTDQMHLFPHLWRTQDELVALCLEPVIEVLVSPADVAVPQPRATV